jgi:fructose-1,6-bisphosphatase/inositol monophosphatase family enzyme
MGGDLPVGVQPRDVERYHVAAIELADEARRIVGQALVAGFGVQTKADASLVTDMDHEVERRLRERLNFTRHLEEGRLFETLTRRYPNHRIYRAAYAHTAAVIGAADAMVDMHDQVWDLAPSQVLIEEAGDRYTVVRDFRTPDGGPIGQPAVVDRVVAIFAEAARPGA